MTPELERNINDNPLGVYRHKEAGAELIATEVPQADALVRVGYKWVREATEADLAPASVVEETPAPKKKAQADASAQ